MSLWHGTSSEGDSARGLQTGQWSACLYAEGAPPLLQEGKGLGLPAQKDLRLSLQEIKLSFKNSYQACLW